MLLKILVGLFKILAKYAHHSVFVMDVNNFPNVRSSGYNLRHLIALTFFPSFFFQFPNPGYVDFLHS